MKPRRPRENSDFRGQTVKKLQPFQARRVEIIMDVVRQVDPHGLDREAETRGPLLGNGF